MGFPENVLIQWVCVGLAVLIGVPAVLAPFLRWRTTHYVITTHRVMVRRGILSKSGKDITLSKITDVSFHQSLLDRIIKSGSLSIESASDSADEDLRNIPHSDAIQQLINHLIDEDATTRAQRARGGGDPWTTRGSGHAERKLRPWISEEEDAPWTTTRHRGRHRGRVPLRHEPSGLRVTSCSPAAKSMPWRSPTSPSPRWVTASTGA